MRNDWLLTVAGLGIVMFAIVGGMGLAGVLQHYLTPDFELGYVLWLWVCVAPFFWLCNKYVGYQYPLAAYLGLLPLTIGMHYVQQQLEPDSPWRQVVFVVGILGYTTLLKWVLGRFAPQPRVDEKPAL